MSDFLFIGPYAEWRVRLGKKTPLDYADEPWFDTLVCTGILSVATADGIPEIYVGRVRYALYRFLPSQERPDAPPRQMAFQCGLGVSTGDWSWVNPRAEIDWFSEAFAPELAMLADHFGAPPSLGWGATQSY